LRRQVAKVSTVLLLGWLLGCKPSPTQLVQQAIEARGGLERLHAIQSERLSGKIFFGSQVGTLRVEFKRPDRMRMEIGLPGKTLVRLLDGDSGWTLDTSGTHSEFKPMSADELEQARREADIDGPLVDSKAKGIRIAVAGQSQVQGRATDELEITFQDGTLQRYQLDAATHEPVGWAERDVKHRATTFVAAQRVDGVLFPTSIETAATGGHPAQRILIERIELNPPLDDTRFRPPTAGGAPPP
jgi:outer membrane lipoprotein-sorting protein